MSSIKLFSSFLIVLICCTYGFTASFFFLSKAERSGSSPFMVSSVEKGNLWNVRAPVKKDITTIPFWNQGAPCVRSYS